MVRRFKTRKLKKRGGGLFDFGPGAAVPAPDAGDAAPAPDADKAAPASVSWFTGIQKKLGFNKPECPECPKCAEERGQSGILTDPSLGDTTSSGDIPSSPSSGDIPSSPSSDYYNTPPPPSSGDIPSSDIPYQGDIQDDIQGNTNPGQQDGGRRRRTQKKYKGKRRHSRKQLKRRKNSRRSRK